jgi:hypothetical protein
MTDKQERFCQEYMIDLNALATKSIDNGKERKMGSADLGR